MDKKRSLCILMESLLFFSTVFLVSSWWCWSLVVEILDEVVVSHTLSIYLRHFIRQKYGFYYVGRYKGGNIP